MAKEQKVSWAFIVAGGGGGDRERIVMWVRVFKFPIDATSSGSACAFPCLKLDVWC